MHVQSESFEIAVRKALIDKGMSQNQLAKEVGATPGYMYHILKGRRPPGKYEIAICAVLGINGLKAS